MSCHIDILNGFKRIIEERKRTPGDRITQKDISDATGINSSNLSGMLAGRKNMYLHQACAIAEALGKKLIIGGAEREKHVNDDKDETFEAVLKALDGARKDAEFARDQALWYRGMYEELRNKVIPIDPHSRKKNNNN